MVVKINKKEKTPVDFRIYNSDCLTQLRLLEENSVDSIVTDPPSGIFFMSANWDHNKGNRDTWVRWMTRIMRECYRVLKPGGHMLCWSIPRTMHWTGWAIESAEFEIRNVVFHINGCLDPATEIATINGVKPYTSLELGDLVLCYRVESNSYSYQPILEIMDYDYEDTAYRLIGDFGDQVVTKKHRVIIKQDRVETFQFAENLKSEVSIPIIENLSNLQQLFFGCDSNSISTEYFTQEIKGWSGHKTSLVRVVPFKYSGKVWCVRVSTGAFVAVRNGVAFPTGNSSFPKNHDISKNMDKHFMKEREVVGMVGSSLSSSARTCMAGELGGLYTKTIPTSAEAKKWDGFGTALKSSCEGWWLAQKPCSEDTIIKNLLKWGTGALNIDACRIPLASNGEDSRLGGKGDWSIDGMAKNVYGGGFAGVRNASSPLGRYPSNVILNHTDKCKLVGSTVINNGKNESPHRVASSEEYWGQGGGGFKQGRSTRSVGDNGYETVGIWECDPNCPASDFPITKSSTSDDSKVESVSATRYFKQLSVDTYWECDSECPTKQFPYTKSGKDVNPTTKEVQGFFGNTMGYYNKEANYGDSGLASRFFKQLSGDTYWDCDSACPTLYFPEAKSGVSNGNASVNIAVDGVTPLRRGTLIPRYDTGTAARFFTQLDNYTDSYTDTIHNFIYSPKASTKDRNTYTSSTVRYNLKLNCPEDIKLKILALIG